MNDLIEFEDVVAELRSGLAEVHFDRQPPRRRRTVRRLAWLSATAAFLMLVLLYVAPGVGDGIAWAAVARPPTAVEQDWITRDCAESLATTPGEWPDTLPELMTSEVRGNMATLMFAGDGWFATCIVEQLTRDDEFAPGLSAIHMGIAADRETLATGDDRLRFGILGLMPDALQGSTFVTGAVAPEITEVVIEVDGLGEVEATVANGWFTAWWPSREPFVVRGFGADNNLIAEATQP
jgi:hypothetical protein